MSISYKLNHSPNVICLIQKLDDIKYPILLTLIFLITISYITFFHHPYWFETDGILYYNWGVDILSGNGQNVKIPDAPIGGPILHVMLNPIFNDPFLTGKIISLLSGTGIVFLSFFIIRNVFDTKIALLGQLFVAINPRLHLLSIESVNELFSIFLIFISLFFITRKSIRIPDLLIIGSLLGAASLIRFQGIPVLMSLLIFVILHRNNIKQNIFFCVILGLTFLAAFSPMLFYNYTIHGTIFDNDTDLYMLWFNKYQTPEWQEKIIETQLTDPKPGSVGITTDFNLFLKNYLHNVFFRNASHLFNFNSFMNMSIITIVPFIGFIPVLGGFLYLTRQNMNKHTLLIVALSTSLVFTLVLIFGQITEHFFAIFIIPLIVLGIFYLRTFNKSLLPLLILSFIYFSMISIVSLAAPYQLLPMWLIIPALSSIFFLKALPSISQKIFRKNHSNKIIFSSVIIIIVLQLGFSYGFLNLHLYENNLLDQSSISQITTNSYYNQLIRVFNNDDVLPSGLEYKEIGDILSHEENIENKYVMARFSGYSYYAHSKFLHAYLTEGVANDTLDNYISRKNWSSYDIYISNIFSFPNDRFNSIHPIPDYIVYQPVPPHSIPQNLNQTQAYDLMILSDPTNSKIPSHFEFLYKSNKTGSVLYKIHHNIVK